MNDNVIENVVKQAELHREIGYLEGLADAYRDMALTRSYALPPLEDELSALVEQFSPPF